MKLKDCFIKSTDIGAVFKTRDGSYCRLDNINMKNITPLDGLDKRKVAKRCYDCEFMEIVDEDTPLIERRRFRTSLLGNFYGDISRECRYDIVSKLDMYVADDYRGSINGLNVRVNKYVQNNREVIETFERKKVQSKPKILQKSLVKSGFGDF